MTDLLDPALWSLLIAVGTLISTLAFRKRIGRAIGRLLFTTAIESFCDTYFDPVEVKDAQGKKRVLMRPNDRLGAVLETYGPLGAAYAMDWAKANVKITLPPFNLPEGVDLKAVGMSALAQKVMSGKKLRVEDAIPLGLGYLKDWLEKSGFVESLSKVGSKVGVKKEEIKELVNPFLQELQP